MICNKSTRTEWKRQILSGRAKTPQVVAASECCSPLRLQTERAASIKATCPWPLRPITAWGAAFSEANVALQIKHSTSQPACHWRGGRTLRNISSDCGWDTEHQTIAPPSVPFSALRRRHAGTLVVMTDSPAVQQRKLIPGCYAHRGMEHCESGCFRAGHCWSHNQCVFIFHDIQDVLPCSLTTEMPRYLSWICIICHLLIIRN